MWVQLNLKILTIVLILYWLGNGLRTLNTLSQARGYPNYRVSIYGCRVLRFEWEKMMQNFFISFLVWRSKHFSSNQISIREIDVWLIQGSPCLSTPLLMDYVEEQDSKRTETLQIRSCQKCFQGFTNSFLNWSNLSTKRLFSNNGHDPEKNLVFPLEACHNFNHNEQRSGSEWQPD